MEIKVCDWIFKVKRNSHLMNDDILENFRNFNEVIYFNDTTGDYWFFMYKIGNVWIEGINVNMTKKIIDIALTQV